MSMSILLLILLLRQLGGKDSYGSMYKGINGSTVTYCYCWQYYCYWFPELYGVYGWRFILFLLSLFCHLCLLYYVFFSNLVLVFILWFYFTVFNFILVSSFHFSSLFIVVSILSIIARFYTSCFIHSSCHCVSPSYRPYILFHSIPSSSSLTVPHYHNEASCYDHHLTASSEFSSFNTIPLSFFLTSQRTRMSHTYNIFI